MENTFKTVKQLQDAAKIALNEKFASLYDELAAVPSGNGRMAFPFAAEVDGKSVEIWVEMTLTAKNPNPRKNGQGGITPAFDPFELEDEYQKELATKAAEKELKAQAAKAKAKKGKKEAAPEA